MSWRVSYDNFSLLLDVSLSANIQRRKFIHWIGNGKTLPALWRKNGFYTRTVAISRLWRICKDSSTYTYMYVRTYVQLLRMKILLHVQIVHNSWNLHDCTSYCKCVVHMYMLEFMPIHHSKDVIGSPKKLHPIHP